MAVYLAEEIARVSQAERLASAERRRRTAAVRHPRVRVALARTLTATARLLAPEEAGRLSEEVA
jgi:hypothetical protein